MAYTYEDFTKAAGAAGLMESFSQDDLAMAQKSPEYGLSMLKLYQDQQGATTAEQRLLAQEAMNQLRTSYRAGSGVTGTEGFQYDREAEYRQLLDNIVHRGSFTYDHQEDPRWGALKKTFTREGERATADALAQAAAATGGVPSSYAVTAATQAGDYYAGQLADKVPELYDDAYSRHLTELGLDIDALGTLEQDRAFDYNAYLQEYEAERQKFDDALSLWQTTGQLTPEIAEVLGMTGELTPDSAVGSTTGAGVTGGSFTGGNVNNGGLTTEQVMELQTALGVAPDGQYGPLSQAAANGLSAEEAYAQYVAGKTDEETGGLSDAAQNVAGKTDEETGGLSDAAQKMLQDMYPTGVVTTWDKWEVLVRKYGEENLIAAGYRYESDGSDYTIVNGHNDRYIAIGHRKYSYDQVEELVASGKIQQEIDDENRTIRYTVSG